VIDKSKFLRATLVVLILVSVVIPLVAAHEDESDSEKGVELKTRAMSVIMISSILVTALVILAIISKERFHNHKKMLFSLMVIPIVAATFYAAGTTIYLNQISLTKGPVHWHADFEVWNCGKKLELINPQEFSNRVGTPVFHEHNDFRIHVEGVVVEEEDISLGNFLRVIGGSLTADTLAVPTPEEMMVMHDGDACNGQPGKIQAFLYRVVNPEAQGQWIYAQEKIENITGYVVAPYSYVPPGDCLIIEFYQEKEKTDKICASYAAAIQRGELHGG
jgi:hypothetical protein